METDDEIQKGEYAVTTYICKIFDRNCKNNEHFP